MYVEHKYSVDPPTLLTNKTEVLSLVKHQDCYKIITNCSTLDSIGIYITITNWYSVELITNWYSVELGQ
jgi:hypothetical protein